VLINTEIQDLHPDESTGVSSIFGIWPGDETEEDLFRSLDEIG
jgi:hypothetical protein